MILTALACLLLLLCVVFGAKGDMPQ